MSITKCEPPIHYNAARRGCLRYMLWRKLWLATCLPQEGQREDHSPSSFGIGMWEPLIQGHKAWVQRMHTSVWISGNELIGAELEKPHTISHQVQVPKTRIWGQDKANGSEKAGKSRERHSGGSWWTEGRDLPSLQMGGSGWGGSWKAPPRPEHQCSTGPNGSVLPTSYFCDSYRAWHYEWSVLDLASHQALLYGSLATLISEVWFPQSQSAVDNL